jgi:hypothetical protein
MINNANDKRDEYKIWDEGMYVQGELYELQTDSGIYA